MDRSRVTLRLSSHVHPEYRVACDWFDRKACPVTVLMLVYREDLIFARIYGSGVRKFVSGHSREVG